MPERNTEDTAAPTFDADRLWPTASALEAPMVHFARRLIQTPSLPGQEGDVAALVASEMQALGYDEVSVDEAGNVIGRIEATAQPSRGRPKRSILFNTHMDHVDVGDPSRWPLPPYDGAVRDGHIWGRGASDLKGPLAAQVYAGALLKRSGVPLPNDFLMTAVVQEEVGGLGSYILAQHFKTDFAVIGEPSANRLALGHRGRTEILVTITGRSVHASIPSSGINPLYSLARFLLSLEGLGFEVDPNNPQLGPTSFAPTLISTDQTSPNVVPGECKLVLDFRNTSADTAEALVARVREILEGSLERGASGSAALQPRVLTSYTGLARTFESTVPGFGVSPSSAFLEEAHEALNRALRRAVTTTVWPFATDAGHLVRAGIQVIGFGPGHEEVIHTMDERISIEEMVEAMVGNAAIALAVR